MTNNKILIISSRQLCYDSAAFFADALAKEFSEMGYEVEFCKIYEGSLPEAADDDMQKMDETFEIPEEISRTLENYVGKQYAAVLDFNSKLPRILLADGTNFLDSIDAPFFDYLLDNPFYHHKSLRCNLKNYNVITPDENHADYIRRYYKNIKSVHMQTIGAYRPSRAVPFEEREKCILLPGTYRRPEGYMEVMKMLTGPMGEIMLKLTDMLTADENMTIETGLRQILEGMGYVDETHTDPGFASQMHEFYYVEKYMRNLYRDRLVTALLEGGIKVKTMGTGWHGYPYKRHENLNIGLPVDYDKSSDKIAECMMLADVSPFFKMGMHDRLPLAFAAGTMVLTDDKPYLRWNGADKLRDAADSKGVYDFVGAADSQRGMDFLYRYSLKEILMGKGVSHDFAGLCDEIRAAMDDKAGFIRRTEEAYALYEEKYTWRKVAENILKMIEKITE